MQWPENYTGGLSSLNPQASLYKHHLDTLSNICTYTAQTVSVASTCFRIRRCWCCAASRCASLLLLPPLVRLSIQARTRAALVKCESSSPTFFWLLRPHNHLPCRHPICPNPIQLGQTIIQKNIIAAPLPQLHHRIRHVANIFINIQSVQASCPPTSFFGQFVPPASVDLS